MKNVQLHNQENRNKNHNDISTHICQEGFYLQKKSH